MNDNKSAYIQTFMKLPLVKEEFMNKANDICYAVGTLCSNRSLLPEDMSFIIAKIRDYKIGNTEWQTIEYELLRKFFSGYLEKTNFAATNIIPNAMIPLVLPNLQESNIRDEELTYLNRCLFELLTYFNETQPQCDDLILSQDELNSFVASGIYQKLSNILVTTDGCFDKFRNCINEEVDKLQIASPEISESLTGSLLTYADISKNYKYFSNQISATIEKIFGDQYRNNFENIQNTRYQNLIPDDIRKALVNEMNVILNDFISDKKFDINATTTAIMTSILIAKHRIESENQSSQNPIENVVDSNKTFLVLTSISMDQIHERIHICEFNNFVNMTYALNKLIESIDGIQDLSAYTELANSINQRVLRDDILQDYFDLNENMDIIDSSDEAEESYIRGLDDIIAMENAYQKTGSSLKKLDVREGFKMAQDGGKKLNIQLGKVLTAIKDFAFDTKDMDRVVIEGKQFTFMGLVKKVLGGIALFSTNWVAAICFYITKWAVKGKATKQSKRKMTMLLEEELEIVKEKVSDASSDGNRKAKYSLMRSQKEIENAIKRLKYNMGAEVSSKEIEKLISRDKEKGEGQGTYHGGASDRL